MNAFQEEDGYDLWLRYNKIPDDTLLNEITPFCDFRIDLK